MNMKNPEIEFFLDSGAFTAWTQETAINLDAYIRFVLKHEPFLSVIANLDVIPGKPGFKNLTAKQITKSASEGWKNWQKMIDAGIPAEKLLHIFHQNEEFQWLQKMVDEPLMTYIGLSPANDRSSSEKARWLDECMNYVTDTEGNPLIKFHGFGVTSHKLLWRYPWYSVDSTSWVITGRMGSIFVPRYQKHKWNYQTPPWKIVVSDRSPSKKVVGRHFSTLSEIEREIVQHYLKERGYDMGESSFQMEKKDYKLKENERWFGKVVEGKREVETIEIVGLCNDYRLRDEINILYYLDFEQAFPKWPFPFKYHQRGLF